MTAFILTWKEQVWPYKFIRMLSAECQREGGVEERWRIRATRVAKRGDLAFLFKQGDNPRGIFAFGYLLDSPSLRSDPRDPGPPRMRSLVHFTRFMDHLRDPFLVPLRELMDVLPTWQINAQASGQAPLTAEAEQWLIRRLGAANIFGERVPY